MQSVNSPLLSHLFAVGVPPKTLIKPGCVTPVTPVIAIFIFIYIYIRTRGFSLYARVYIKLPENGWQGVTGVTQPYFMQVYAATPCVMLGVTGVTDFLSY